MNKSAEPAQPRAALFDWPRRQVFAPYLLGFIGLSALAHVATFFLFRVVYPERVSIPPAPPQVALLTPGTPDNQALLRSIESEQPAHIGAASSAYGSSILPLKYRASFETPRTLPHTSPIPATQIPYPPAKDPLEIIRSAVPRQEPAPADIESRGTTLVFGGTLAARIDPTDLIFHPGQTASDPLQPSDFLIGVGGDGKVRYSFLQRSSGIAALDGEIEAHITGLEFASSPTPMVWERVQVVWGDDVYTRSTP